MICRVHAYRIVDGKKLGDGPGVIVDASFAKTTGIKLGERVEIVTPRGTVRALVSGLFQREGVSATGQGASLLMSLKSAQILYKVPGKIDNAQIVLAPGTDEAQAEAAIAKLLPSGLTVGHPASRSAMADETSLSTKVGMELARGFSLIVAIFIIAITFLINVSQRRKQIGILRAIGATRLQIGIMIYSEAILMGIVGSVLGFIVGVAGARVLSRAMGELYQTSLPAVSLTPKPFILAGVIGLGSHIPRRRPARSPRATALADGRPARRPARRDRRLFAVADHRGCRAGGRWRRDAHAGHSGTRPVHARGLVSHYSAHWPRALVAPGAAAILGGGSRGARAVHAHRKPPRPSGNPPPLLAHHAHLRRRVHCDRHAASGSPMRCSTT